MLAAMNAFLIWLSASSAHHEYHDETSNNAPLDAMIPRAALLPVALTACRDLIAPGGLGDGCCSLCASGRLVSPATPPTTTARPRKQKKYRPVGIWSKMKALCTDTAASDDNKPVMMTLSL